MGSGITPYVVGLDEEVVEGASGDPSPVTAYGVLQGIRAAFQIA